MTRAGFFCVLQATWCSESRRPTTQWDVPLRRRSMTLKRGVTWLHVSVVIALAPDARAASPPQPPPPAEAVRLINDAALTVRARRQVNADKDLHRLNLGVRVTRGVAVVWGPMPSAD